MQHSSESEQKDMEAKSSPLQFNWSDSSELKEQKNTDKEYNNVCHLNMMHRNGDTYFHRNHAF